MGAFWQKLEVRNYGILGAATRNPRDMRDNIEYDVAGKPGPTIMVLDAAGLHHLADNTPHEAGGSARAVYKWCGLVTDRAFPDPAQMLRSWYSAPQGD